MKTYNAPSIGCYIDHANYSADELSEEICYLAINLGWSPDAEALDILNADMDDERSDGPNHDRSEALDELAREAEDFLNSQETRPFLYWSNDGYAGAFGLWPNTEGAKEDCAFVSSRKQEWPADDFRGEWLHINERGNCTLYVRDNASRDCEIWSVV